jgi:hypothetical protein
MAGDWIKMRSDLHSHPKIVRMASATKADRHRIVGGLHAVWCLFDIHSVDGRLDGYTLETLDDMVAFPGIAEAMRLVGWIEIDGDSLVMRDFETHNGQSAKRRANDAERKRAVRNVSAEEADKTRTREEKRREEKTPSTKADGEPAGFADFWAVWPQSERKVAKKQCAMKWKAKNFNSQLPAIVAHIEAMKQSKQWRDGYEPAPLTYLNQERWGDGLPSDAESTSEAGFI